MNRRSYFPTVFLFRGGLGLIAVHLLNTFFVTAGLPLYVGIGVPSALVSGILGAPGVLLLYGVSLCERLL